MARGALGLFLLEAAFGTAALLPFFPSGPLGKGFFTLHGWIAAGCLALAWPAAPAGLWRPALLAALGLILLFLFLAHADKVRIGLPLLIGGALASGAALASVAWKVGEGSSGAWTVAGAALGGLFFGSVLLTMNLGHWYLVSRSLPFKLLARGAAAFGIFAIVRTLLLLAALWINPAPEGLPALFSLERDALFFLFRVLWGILGPLALAYFVWRTAELRSNQAATGLLYVALVFVLIGELLSSYLTVATGFPA
jgi:hypothetical protein